MEILQIVDDLENMIKESKKLPLSSGKIMIESHKFLDRLDRMRAILPEELETARLVLAEKERIIRDAHDEAGHFVEESRNQAARMMDDNEITRNAMQMAEEIVAKAEDVARGIRRDADEYAEGVLSHMEIILKKGLDVITQGKAEIRFSLEKDDY